MRLKLRRMNRLLNDRTARLKAFQPFASESENLACRQGAMSLACVNQAENADCIMIHATSRNPNALLEMDWSRAQAQVP
jgi:hypothetical protein